MVLKVNKPESLKHRKTTLSFFGKVLELQKNKIVLCSYDYNILILPLERISNNTNIS